VTPVVGRTGAVRSAAGSAATLLVATVVSMSPELGGLTAVVGGGAVGRAEVAGAGPVVPAAVFAVVPGDPWVGVAREPPPVDRESGEFDVGVAGAVGRVEGAVGARAGLDDDVGPADGEPVAFGATAACVADVLRWDACAAGLDDERGVAVQPAMMAIIRIATANPIHRTSEPTVRDWSVDPFRGDLVFMSEPVRHDAVAWSRDIVAGSDRDVLLPDGVRPDRRKARSPVARPATPQSSQATVPTVIPPGVGADAAPVGGSIAIAAMPAAAMRKIPTAKDTSPTRLDITRSKVVTRSVCLHPGTPSFEVVATYSGHLIVRSTPQDA